MPAPIRDPQQLPFLHQLQERAKPEDTLEIVNVSAAPETGFHRDQMTSLKADAWGKYRGDVVDIQEGDHLRVRTRNASGQTSPWISLQVQGTGGEDTRNAQIGPQGVGVRAEADGSLRPIALGGGMLSEPGAILQFTNLRTGHQVQFALTEEGRIPDHIKLQGQVGDSFQLAVSDGVNNTDFSWIVGQPILAKSGQTDLQDPNTSRQYRRMDGSASLNKVRASGSLFVHGAQATDVKQGSLGNCYFCAASAAVAHVRPEHIENMMKDNGDGTYTVTFRVEEPPDSGQYQQRSVTVDGELYARSPGGTPVYGGSTGNTQPNNMEMWFPILEKAFAALRDGDYQNIESGWSHKTMMMLTGSTHNDEYFLPNGQAEHVFAQIMEAQEKGWPGTAVTYDKSTPEGSRYGGSRIYASHAYSILGAKEEDGKQYVQLRNPWGSSEPGYDGKDDGVFWLEMNQFLHYFQWANITHAA